MNRWNRLRADTARSRDVSPSARRLSPCSHRLIAMTRTGRSLLLAGLVSLAAAGCGGASSNSVEFPENPDPMPSQSPVAAGQAAPAPQPVE